MNSLTRNMRLWLALLLLPACTFFKPTIKEIDSIAQAQDELAKADQQTLVVFDIDDTLIRPTAQSVQFMFKHDAYSKEDVDFMVQLKTKFKKHVERMTPAAADAYAKKLWSKQLLKSAYCPVEPSTIDTVKKLQARGIKIIALSAVRPGPRGEIASMQKWRFDELIKVGIDFSAAFSVQEIIFEQLLLDEGYPPMFYRGILMATRTNTKGKVLAAFLDHIGWMPKKVLYFDDGKHHVESVIEEMHVRGIACQGYWYKATLRQKHELNHKIIQTQFDYFMAHDEVPNDDEAAAMMQKNRMAKPPLFQQRKI